MSIVYQIHKHCQVHGEEILKKVKNSIFFTVFFALIPVFNSKLLNELKFL